MSAEIEQKRQRLIYRAQHCGTREMDLLVGRFAAENVPGFDEAQLDMFESLLTCGREKLYDWMTRAEEVPAAFDNDVMRMLRKLA